MPQYLRDRAGMDESIENAHVVDDARIDVTTTTKTGEKKGFRYYIVRKNTEDKWLIALVSDIAPTQELPKVEEEKVRKAVEKYSLKELGTIYGEKRGLATRIEADLKRPQEPTGDLLVDSTRAQGRAGRVELLETLHHDMRIASVAILRKLSD